MEATNIRLLEELMALWDKYSEEYCSIIDEYNELLEKKRSMGLKLNKINKADLKDFPKIHFLEIENEDGAINYLLKKDETDMKRLIVELQENYVESKIRYDLISKIWDYKYTIRMAKIRQTYDGTLSMDPSACGCGRKTPSPLTF